MDSRRIGPRPAKFNFGQAFAAAAQGGGAYYGQLAIEKKNAEALAQARGYQIEDRTYAAEQAATVRDEGRVYQEGRVDEDRAYREGQAASERELGLADLAEQRAYEEGQPRDMYPGSSIEPVPGEDGVVRRVLHDSAGNPVQDMGVDPDYVTGPDGTVQRLSAGGRGATAATQSEARMKLEVNATNMRTGLGIIKESLGEGYDPRSGQAMADMVTDRIGGAANWLTSAEGQKFNAGLKMAGEAMFKGLSGAAGSDKEAARFYSMFPAPGDLPSTVEVKLRMVESTLAAFEKASGMTNDLDSVVLYTRSIATQQAFESGFDLESGKLNEPAATSPEIGLTQEQQSLYDKYR